MDLFLVHNDPRHTVLVSPNGVAHYQTRTIKLSSGIQLTVIQRPADTTEDSIVAEIEWKCWEAPTIIRSPLLGGLGRSMGKEGIGVLASQFLYKKQRFSPSRYFMGDDAKEYKCKPLKGMGYVLTQEETGEEIARYATVTKTEGLFAGEKRSVLRIQPCSVDLDLVVLSFVILEKKRRDRTGNVTRPMYDEDPQGDGGGSGEAE